MAKSHGYVVLVCNVTGLFEPEKVWDKVWFHGSPAAGHIGRGMAMGQWRREGESERASDDGSDDHGRTGLDCGGDLCG